MSSPMHGSVTESTQKLLARAALVAGLLLLISQLTFPDPDMFHAMALVRESLQLGHVPEVDLFAYTPTVSPATHHEWGSGAVLYFVTVGLGLGSAGLLTLKYLLTSGVVAGCFRCAKRNGAAEPIVLLLAPIAILLGWVGFTTIRAQLFTLVFLTVLMLFFQLDRRGQRWWIFLWPPMFVVWFNMHGGVVAGVGLYGLHAIEQFVRHYGNQRSLRAAVVSTAHLLIGGLLIVPLSALNPYGLDFGPCLLDAIRLERPLILEWGPLWTSPEPFLSLLTFAASLVAVISAIRQRGWTQLAGLPLVLIGAWLALMHIRHGSIYAVIWMCYVPGYFAGTPLEANLQQLWDRQRQGIAVAATVCLCYCGTLTVLHRPWELRLPTTQPIGPLLYPSGAVDYLERVHFTGNVMTPFRAGSFVSWRLYPEVKVSFDGRYEAAYPPSALAENFAFYAAEAGWRDSLQRYRTDAVLVPTASALCRQLSDEPGWQRLYEDDGYSVLARSPAAAKHPIESRRGIPVTMTFP